MNVLSTCFFSFLYWTASLFNGFCFSGKDNPPPSVITIIHQHGVLPRPARQSNGYRRYGQADVNRLILLRRLRLLGVPLTALTPLLVGASDARCVEVQHDLLALVTFRLLALDQEIVELHLLRDQVERYQHQLTDCHPDERESFRACRDMSCLALPGEMAQEQENYYAHVPNV